MNKASLIFATALLCSSFAFADDDDVEEGPDTRPYVCIDPKAIENKTDNKTANFDGLIDRLENALVECGVYRVLNKKTAAEGVSDDDWFKVVAADDGKESKMETPAMKVTMTIMTYGVASASGTDPYGQSRVMQQATVELILKVVDMRTKETLKSKNVSGTAKGSATANANLVEQVLQAANKKVVDDIVDTLIKLTPFNVLDVEDGEVVVDVPPSRVKSGSQLTVFKKGKKIRNPRTGRWTAKETRVATIGVVTIGEDSLTCKLLDGKITPDEDAEEGAEYAKYIVRIPDGQQSPAPAPAPAPEGPASPF